MKVCVSTSRTSDLSSDTDLSRYAVELGVVIGKDGRDIRAADAEDHIGGYGGSLSSCLLLQRVRR